MTTNKDNNPIKKQLSSPKKYPQHQTKMINYKNQQKNPIWQSHHLKLEKHLMLIKKSILMKGRTSKTTLEARPTKYSVSTTNSDEVLSPLTPS